ncbi:MAG: hypothetical protein NXY57DRAFT_962457 [Lentinula lateritia]|nr:MAG: hypothetical protein NXY57DRAFT_962457 [Lentinula lateritia]
MTDDSNTAGLYSPSDDSEGQVSSPFRIPVLRDFVNETLAHERDHPEDSPRSELLSPIHGAATSHDSPAAVEHHQDSRSRRGPSQRYRRERESAYRGLDQREVLRLLIEHEYEASKMRKTLYMVFSKLEAEIQRSAEAESQVQAYIKRFKELNAEKLNVERESHTLEAELTLYKIQYDLAQKEIVKTRDTVLALQTQLDAAENDARKARGDARKVKEALEIWKAREEGRRQGFEAGWNRAREEFGALNAQTVLEYGNEYSDNLPPPELSSFQRTDAQGSGDGDDSISYRTYPPPDQRGLLQFPEVPMVPASIFNDPPPQSLPIPESISRRSSVSERPRQAIPAHVSSRPFSTRPDMATPAVQMYSLPIPPANEVEFHNRPQSSIRLTNSKQPQPQPQPWLAETPITRASSPRPPDNFIPAASEDGHIALPPPHELAEYPPSPQPTINTLPGNTAYSSHGASMAEGPRREYTSSKGKARATDSWYNHRGEVDSRAHTPDVAVANGVLQPEASTSWYQDRPRRASMSSRYSANSSGGLLDAWGYPIQTETKRSGGLGNTLKNIFKGKGKDARMLSMITENPLSRQGSLNVGPVLSPSVEPSGSFRGHTDQGISPTGSNQRFAEEIRYDNFDPTKRERARPLKDISSSQDRPPRNVRIPAHLTVPPLLATQQRGGHGRAISLGSADPRFHGSPYPPQTDTSRSRNDGPSSQQAARGGPNRSSKRASMSGHYIDSTSPPVSISVQPPSQSPSDAPNGLHSATRSGSGTPELSYLSSDEYPASWPDRVRPRSASLSQANYTSSASPKRQDSNNPSSPPDRTGSPGFSDRYGQNNQALRGARSPSNVDSIHSRAPSRASNPHQHPASTASFQHTQPLTSIGGNNHVSGTPVSFKNRPLLGSNHKQSGSTEGGAGLKRVMSNLSAKSAGSQYSHFDPETYRDPAYFPLDTT